MPAISLEHANDPFTLVSSIAEAQRRHAQLIDIPYTDGLTPIKSHLKSPNSPDPLLDFDCSPTSYAFSPDYDMSADTETSEDSACLLEAGTSASNKRGRTSLYFDCLHNQNPFSLPTQLLFAGASFFFIVLVSFRSTFTSNAALRDVWSLRTAFTAPAQVRSNWFNDDGYLSFDADPGWETSWNTIVPQNGSASPSFLCDRTTHLRDGHTVCSSGLQLLRSLRNSLELQDNLHRTQNPAVQEKLQEEAKTLAYLRGRRILILGDSIDRDMFNTWATIYQASTHVQQFLIHDEAVHHEGWQQTEVASLVIPIARDMSEVESSETLRAGFQPAYTGAQPEHHFRVDFAFLIGSMSEKPFDFGPFDPNERIKRALNLLGTTGPDSYDYVSLNYALWDMAAIQRQALQNDGADPSAGLLPDSLSRYIDNLGYQVNHLRTILPGAHLSLRLIHEVISNMHAAPADADDMEGIESIPTFKPLRLVQIRAAQIATAKRFGIDMNPFALRMMGQGSNFTVDTVHPARAANMLVIELILRQLAEPL